MSLIDRLTNQLDGLVVFLAAANEAVFDLVREHEAEWIGTLDGPHAPTIFEEYRRNVVHGAFLLGCAYFEAFLTDLFRAILTSRPAMMAQQREVSVGAVVNAGSYPLLVKRLIEGEIRSVFYKSLEDQREYFINKLRVDWPEEPKLVIAARIRNCLMHNNGTVEERLAEVSSYPPGSTINLNSSDVHDYGLLVRALAPKMWASANSRHLR